MYKVRKFSLTLSIVCLATLCLSSLSSAFAQDELARSWQIYQESRVLLADSFAQINNSWDLLDAGWNQVDTFEWGEWDRTWTNLELTWTWIERRRVMIASETGVTLYDETPRITRFTKPRGIFRTYFRADTSLPYTPDLSSGTWEELANAWTVVDAGWAKANGQWASLNSAWPELGAAANESSEQFVLIRQSNEQLRVAAQGDIGAFVAPIFQ